MTKELQKTLNLRFPFRPAKKGDSTLLGSDTEEPITPLARKVLVSSSMVSCCCGKNLLSRVTFRGKHNGSKSNSRRQLDLHCKMQGSDIRPFIQERFQLTRHKRRLRINNTLYHEHIISDLW